jgi:hypothetical protein
MEEVFGMSGRERDRLVELEFVAAEKQTLRTAADRLGLSYRQAKRAKPAGLRRRVLALYEERLEGFGPTLASEKLSSLWEVEVSAETLRRWLIAEGLWKIRRRRRTHRQWRPRSASSWRACPLPPSTSSPCCRSSL